MVVLADVDGGVELEGVLGGILASLAAPVALPEGTAANVSASIGIAIFPDDSSEKGILMRKADHAMYVAKGLGKGRFVRASGDAPTTANVKSG